MKKVVHRSENMGFTDKGWLKAYSVFSSGTYYDPRRIHFGALRTLNSYIVDSDKGFGSHPHDNIEIVHIPLFGATGYSDNIGNNNVLSVGELHVISAGTGVIYNSYNNSKDDVVAFLSVWIFPQENDIQPRYNKVKLSESVKNEVRLVVCPDGSELRDDNVGRIQQKAWLSTLEADKGERVEYKLHSDITGVYVFVLDGEVVIEETKLRKHDGLGVSEVSRFTVQADSNANLLFVEVPMAMIRHESEE